ncbi:MAG TPA: asparagine synthase (glutamine-hydrolyzing), partial [Candidatus Limnocylindrales bacterium]|nr:asparagine synthase (glutamine-hydrolyzing) [Candidatus Limnocylindrales bacterium]
ELIALGQSFRSHSDSEVLLKAYAQWGPECVKHFNGMWAFALWDEQDRRLFCSRDRFGEKQLYFRSISDGECFWFASEIRPLLTAAGAVNEINEALVWDFLVYGLADHTEETFFGGIHQLLPGHNLILRPGGEPQVWQYYQLQPETLEPGLTDEQLADGLRQRLYEAVRLRLRSDVPLASFFSGGMDSASIVALADQIISARDADFVSDLRTYTNCYPPGHHYDESPRVRAALPLLKNVEPVFIQASENSLQEELMDLVRTQEQPFHNVSIFASYNLLRLVKEHGGAKVVLTGEAGDEMLAGYQRVYLPLFFRDMVLHLRWPSWVAETLSWGPAAACKWTAKGFFNDLPSSLRIAANRRANAVVGMMQPDFFSAHASREARWVEQWRRGPLQHRLNADVTRFNLPQLLRHLDRNAMCFSIETRVPFLDPAVVEYCAALPARMKLRRGYSKYALRRAMENRLPDEITWNRKKLGFGMAEQFWFRHCAELMQQIPGLRQFVDVKALVKSLREEGTINQGYWLPVCIGLWMHHFIRPSAAQFHGGEGPYEVRSREKLSLHGVSE